MEIQWRISQIVPLSVCRLVSWFNQLGLLVFWLLCWLDYQTVSQSAKQIETMKISTFFQKKPKKANSSVARKTVQECPIIENFNLESSRIRDQARVLNSINETGFGLAKRYTKDKPMSGFQTADFVRIQFVWTSSWSSNFERFTHSDDFPWLLFSNLTLTRL